jgi:hypothetical protein
LFETDARNIDSSISPLHHTPATPLLTDPLVQAHSSTGSASATTATTRTRQRGARQRQGAARTSGRLGGGLLGGLLVLDLMAAGHGLLRGGLGNGLLHSRLLHNGRSNRLLHNGRGRRRRSGCGCSNGSSDRCGCSNGSSDRLRRGYQRNRDRAQSSGKQYLGHCGHGGNGARWLLLISAFSVRKTRSANAKPRDAVPHRTSTAPSP